VKLRLAIVSAKLATGCPFESLLPKYWALFGLCHNLQKQTETHALSHIPRCARARCAHRHGRAGMDRLRDAYAAWPEFYFLRYKYVPDIMEKRGPHRPKHLELAAAALKEVSRTHACRFTLHSSHTGGKLHCTACIHCGGKDASARTQ
jgi:hypothetical protein